MYTVLDGQIKVNNYVKYKQYLGKLIGDETILNKLIELVGGEEMLLNASFGMTEDSNTAYDGALINIVLQIADYAKKINELLPENKRVENSSIYKVALLHHIAKVTMYVRNTNEWEIKNRGILYKFNDKQISLKCGERSLYYAMSAGVSFTEEEFEAMRVIDKINDGSDAIRWYGGTLATVIRQANEIITMLNK